MSVAAPELRARRRARPRVLVGRLGLDRVELGALLALAALSVAILAGLLLRGRPLSGADGLLAADELQYFAWIRDAGEHVLIGNRFDLAPGPRSFLHPGFLLSGMVHRVLGLSVPAAYLLWKPVAVGLTFFACRAYVRRLLPPGGQRHVALILALFAIMPASSFVTWSGWGGKPREYTFAFITGEMWSGQYLWGYLMTALAVFLMPVVLLGIERWRVERRRSILAWAAVGTLVVCWLQPWQGATLAVIVVGVEAWRCARTRERPPLALAVVPLAAAIPSAYYFALATWDPSWKLAGEVNAAGAQAEWSWPWWAMVLVVLPLAAPAVLAYRGRAASWQEMALRLWPFAALAVYLQPAGTFPYHSFQGLTLPLAILAVQGISGRWRPRRALVVAALFVMIVPGLASRVQAAAHNVHAGADPYFVFGGEVRALKWLEANPRPGGVLASAYAGYMIPSRTGREVYVGALSWSPDWGTRGRRADALFEGRMTGEPARRFVLSTGARFLFGDCRPGVRDLSGELAGLVERVQRFGCATVYVLRPRPGQARVGPPDA